MLLDFFSLFIVTFAVAHTEIYNFLREFHSQRMMLFVVDGGWMDWCAISGVVSCFIYFSRHNDCGRLWTQRRPCVNRHNRFDNHLRQTVSFRIRSTRANELITCQWAGVFAMVCIFKHTYRESRSSIRSLQVRQAPYNWINALPLTVNPCAGSRVSRFNVIALGAIGGRRCGASHRESHRAKRAEWWIITCCAVLSRWFELMMMPMLLMP